MVRRVEALDFSGCNGATSLAVSILIRPIRSRLFDRNAWRCSRIELLNRSYVDFTMTAHSTAAHKMNPQKANRQKSGRRLRGNRD